MHGYLLVLDCHEVRVDAVYGGVALILRITCPCRFLDTQHDS
jgi:hypothetical protein